MFGPFPQEAVCHLPFPGQGVEVKKTRWNRCQGQMLSNLVKEHSVKHLETLSGARGWGHVWKNRNSITQIFLVELPQLRK